MFHQFAEYNFKVQGYYTTIKKMNKQATAIQRHEMVKQLLFLDLRTFKRKEECSKITEEQEP